MLATKVDGTHRRRRAVGQRHRPAAGRPRALGAREPARRRAHRRQRHRRHRVLRRPKDVRRRRPHDRRRGPLLGRGRGLAPRALRAAARGAGRSCRRTSSCTRDWMGARDGPRRRAARGDGDRLGRSILGGETMRAYEADWSTLGSGETPWTPGPRARGRRARRGGPRERGGARVRAARRARGRAGRARGSHARRRRASSTAAGRAAGASASWRTFARAPAARLHRALRARPPARVLRVLANGEPVGELDAQTTRPTGASAPFDIPARLAGERTSYRAALLRRVTTFHYWFAHSAAGLTGG